MRLMEETEQPTEEITLLLGDARKGSALAQERLYAHVYRELHRLAERQLRGDREHGGATSLVHEAFFKLSRAPTEFNDRQHFFATAARAMRQILIDRARRKLAEKRGAGVVPESIDDIDVAGIGSPHELVALDDALSVLAKLDPRAAAVVEMRVFAGLTIEETAQALDIHPSSVNREWAQASAWLREQLGDDRGD